MADRLLAEDVLRPIVTHEYVDVDEVTDALFAAAGDPDELVLRRTPEGTELLVAERHGVFLGDRPGEYGVDYTIDTGSGREFLFRHRPVAAPIAGNETTDYSRHHFAAPEEGGDDA